MKFDDMILEAAKSIANATASLIKAASEAQKELVAQGKVLAVISGPPCETWSIVRFLLGSPIPIRCMENIWCHPKISPKLY